MAKTAYRTWIPLEMATAAMLNEQIRDNGNEIWKGTTAGDMDYYTSSTTKSRLGIGAENDTLTVISASAPGWKGYSSCRLIRTTAQTIANDSETQLTGWTSEGWDTDAYHAGANAYMTVPVTGLYLCVLNGYWQSGTAGTLRQLAIVAGATDVVRDTRPAWAGGNMAHHISGQLYMTSGTLIQATCKQINGGNLTFEQFNFTVARIK